MIQCPNCAKDIADDSAHCGFCGAKIQDEAGKKTMMGFAALTGDTLREAAAEAKQAREDAEKARAEQAPMGLPSRPKRDEATDSKPKLPQLPRPTPHSGTPSAPGKLDLTPADDPNSSDAKTAVMGAVTPSTIEEGAIDVGDTDPMPQRVPDDEPTTIPTPTNSEETEPELIAPQMVRSGPSSMGSGLGVDGPSEFGSGKIDIPQNTLPAKKKTNPALLVGGAIAFLLLACCFLSIAYNVILPIILTL